MVVHYHALLLGGFQKYFTYLIRRNKSLIVMPSFTTNFYAWLEAYNPQQQYNFGPYPCLLVVAEQTTYLELLKPFLMVASSETNATFEDQRAALSP